MITTNRKMTDSPIVHRIVGLIEEQGKKMRNTRKHKRTDMNVPKSG